jgi:hypothetical protein
MDEVATTDLYEAAFYLLSGCTLEAIQCLPVSGKREVQFSFSGRHLAALQLTYLQSRAEVNLFAFRRAYGQINAYLHEAKKAARREEQQAGGERR